MKRVIILLVFELLTMSVIAQTDNQASPIDQKAIIGVWHGHYEQNGVNKVLKIDFREVDGILECYFDIPDRGLKNCKFEISICSENEFHLQRTGADNVPLNFVGKPDGHKMTGRYKIGDTCGPGKPPSFTVAKVNEL